MAGSAVCDTPTAVPVWHDKCKAYVPTGTATGTQYHFPPAPHRAAGSSQSHGESGGSLSHPIRTCRRDDQGQEKLPWRDTHLKIEGPVVAQFQQLFLETWEKQKGDPLPPKRYLPHMPGALTTPTSWRPG
jgi:hypothetical protein